MLSAMNRILLLLLLLFALAAPAFGECDLRSVWRGQQVQNYVPKARACLDTPTEGFWFDEAVEREIADLVNAARIGAGLGVLEVRAELLPPARIHSFDMAQEDFFAHKGADGRKSVDRIGALDRTLVQAEVRENIGKIGGDLDYRDSAKLLHSLLMNSEGHKANILAPNVTHMGIGVSRTEKAAWVTQVFVRQAGELTEPLPLAMQGRVPLSLPDAELDTWAFKAYAFRAADDTEHAIDAPLSGLRDDGTLLVIGKKAVSENAFQLIKLKGPVLTFIP